MRVFIRSLPVATSERDVRSFVLGAICSRFHRFLRRQNRITSIEIIELASTSGEPLEYHAIVDFERTDIALLAIKKLDGTHLKGMPVAVRRYCERSNYRDRRRQRSEIPILAIHDRRRGGRRRLELQQRKVDVAGKPFPTGNKPNYTIEAAQTPLY